MSNTTHGATRAKLIENGYAPVAMDRSYGFMSADSPGAMLTVPGYQSECGLADYDKRKVITLAIIARDTKVRTDILKVLSKHVGKSPVVRVSSDGGEHYVCQWNDSTVPYSMWTDPLTGEYDPAAAVISQVTDSQGKRQPALIRLDGEWRGGSPLTVPRSKLPTLDGGKLAAMFDEIKAVLRQHLPVAEYRVPLSPDAIRAKAERERLEAEVQKRSDAEIWQMVEQRARTVASSGAAQWDKARNSALVQTDQWRISTYDAIVAEREETEA